MTVPTSCQNDFYLAMFNLIMKHPCFNRGQLLEELLVSTTPSSLSSFHGAMMFNIMKLRTLSIMKLSITKNAPYNMMTLDS